MSEPIGIRKTEPMTENRRDRNRELTRGVILQAAREEFSKSGYADAQLSRIVEAAGVTTGAVYHHFGDKKGLFIAVAHVVEESLFEEVLRVSAVQKDRWAQVRTGMAMILSMAVEDNVRRIVFVDAPTVIGPAEWREIELQYAFGAMVETLNVLKKEGRLLATDTRVTAQILLGAVTEAANAVAQSDNSSRALKDARRTLEALFKALEKE